MRKLALAMTALAASTLGTAVSAAPIMTTITPTTPRDNDAIGGASNSSITSGTPTCSDAPTAAGYACSFTSQFSFATPTGYNLASAALTSTFTDGNAQQDIDFTGISLNGVTGAFLNDFDGYTDTATVNNVALMTNGTNNILTVTGNAGSTARGAAAAFSGVLTFAASPTVPEPATWAMMLVGFGAAGYSLRRKKSSSIRMQAA